MLPELPPEVLAQVFGHLNVGDIGKARQVCRIWRAVMCANLPSLWIARFNALGVLPLGARSVLVAHVAKTIERAEVAACSAAGVVLAFNAK